MIINQNNKTGIYYNRQKIHLPKTQRIVDPCLLPAGTIIGDAVVRVSADSETYSEAGYILAPDGRVLGVNPQGKGGLPVVGTPVYAEHPTTEARCWYYDLKDGHGRRLWTPAMPNPQPLCDHIAAGGELEAWNVTFEFWIWNMIMVPRYGWPPLELEQCYCAMAKARRYSLPGKLDIAAKVLGTPRKDPDGDRLLKKLSKPVKHTKAHPSFTWTPAEAWKDYLKLYAYCGDDVRAEDHASAHTPELTPYERSMWLTDQTINLRGVQIDTRSLDACLDILIQAEVKYDKELQKITKGKVSSVNAVAQIVKWVNEHGIEIPNLKAETVEETLQWKHLPKKAKRVLQIRASLGSANVKKLRTLKLQVSSDGRLRDQYIYCGAPATGRASAGGVQLQNMTGKGPPTALCEACGRISHGKHKDCLRCGSFLMQGLPGWSVEAATDALRDIRTGSLKHVEHIWGDAIEVLCGCLRALLIADKGKKLICCDFSAIEAVVTACLSQCDWRIKVFQTHGKIYEMGASKITGIPFKEFLKYKKRTKQDHPMRKKIGKPTELLCGFGGWIGAFVRAGADKYMTEAEMKTNILKWRQDSPEIVAMWGGQFLWCGPGKWDFRPELHGLEGAAIMAIRDPGQVYSYLDIEYGMEGDALRCKLPSGRFLTYHNARLVPGEDKLRRGPSVQILFEGYNSNAQKGPVGWMVMETYGAWLFQNVVQATAADLQFEALMRLEAAGYPVVMHTHDEATVEVPKDFGSVKKMTRIMIKRPSWAKWWPIRAAGWQGKRSRKD